MFPGRVMIYWGVVADSAAWMADPLGQTRMEPLMTASDMQLSQLLDAIQVGLLLCDRSRRVVLVNGVAATLFSQAGVAANGRLCHALLFGSDTSCEGCPAGVGEERGAKRQTITLSRPGGDIYLKVFCRPWQDRSLLTIHDVTREITLLRRSDLDRKELQAKNILLERRRRLNAEEQEFLTQLLDRLPEAVLTVDANFRVQRKNMALTAMVAGQNHTHCHAMFGHAQPCPACPAAEGFAKADGQKKSQELGGQVITEIFSVAPNGQDGLLIFRDITRQVTLIEQIRFHQGEIARKNKFLSLLVEFGTQLQKGSDAGEVTDYFLDSVLPNLHTGAVALIVHDVRAGNLWFARQRNMAEEDFKALSRACLSRELQAFKADERIAEAKLPWRQSWQIPLVGSKGQRVGFVVFEGEPGEEELAFLRLVTEPLGAYFQNQLLYRQLEEKANKDALTGLFNRGYLGQALEEEREKFEKYGVHHAVVLADINGLKKINDQHGHDCGDQLIVAAATAMQETLRNTDIAARTGGDEFVILLSSCTDEDAGHFVSRLQNEVFAGLALPLPDGGEYQITVSLGKAGTDKYPAETLLKEADRQMYSAKEEFYKTAGCRR